MAPEGSDEAASAVDREGHRPAGAHVVEGRPFRIQDQILSAALGDDVELSRVAGMRLLEPPGRNDAREVSPALLHRRQRRPGRARQVGDDLVRHPRRLSCV